MEQSLRISRAIEQSLGLSGNEIYAKGLELIKKYNLSGSILDFGSGRGRFLQIMSQMNFTRVTGADLMEKPADLPSTCGWIQHDLNDELPMTEQFDSVIGMEVIEHLENPRKMVRECHRLLKPGGKLILSTPNNLSIRSILALIMRGHFVSFLEKDYPAHITALTRLDLERILTESGFTDIAFYFTNKGLVPGLRGLTWQKLSLGFLQGEKFSDNIFVVAIKS